MRFLEAQALHQKQLEEKARHPANTKAPVIEDKMLRGVTETFSAPQSEATEEMVEASINSEVRALAVKLGVDLSSVQGTGKNGRILVRDVRAAAGTSD